MIAQVFTQYIFTNMLYRYWLYKKPLIIPVDIVQLNKLYKKTFSELLSYQLKNLYKRYSVFIIKSG